MVFEQAEDEIAAIHMAMGVSFAGARSMVATSGGGFSLMVEGLSLAGCTETPLVIFLAQRPRACYGPCNSHRAGRPSVLPPRWPRGIPPGHPGSGNC